MLRDYRTVRAVATRVAEAAEAAMDAYRSGRMTDEPHITDRFMGIVEEKVRGFIAPPPPADEPDWPGLPDESPRLLRASVTEAFSGAPAKPPRRPIRWEAKTLRSGSGAAAEEKRFGADILGVLSVDVPEYKTDKGFLAQAKRAEPGQPFAPVEWNRLVGQCRAMLSVTRDAYVMVYSKEAGVRFFAAQAVVSFGGRDLFELYDLGTRTFFERHIQSYIGDTHLDQPDIAVLKQIQERRDEIGASANVLHLSGHTVSGPLRLD